MMGCVLVLEPLLQLAAYVGLMKSVVGNYCTVPSLNEEEEKEKTALIGTWEISYILWVVVVLVVFAKCVWVF